MRAAHADGFTIVHVADFSTPPNEAYAALGRIGRWWNGAHTYSGDASRLRLRLEAGGCFCERWAGGSVEHGRVIVAMPGQTLRLDAPLGPLQGMGVRGVLTFAITPAEGGSHLEMTFEAVGRDDQGLEALAPIVDRVLGEQFGRLNRYLATGSPT